MNEKKLIIIGAGGFSKEVAWLAEECGRVVHGFLDDNREQGELVYKYPVVGLIEKHVDYLDCEFLIAFGNPRLRKKIADSLGQVTFATLVHPDVRMSSAVSIGAGSVICAGNILTVEIVVGKHVHINLNCTVGHDTFIGDFVTMAPQSVISGNVEINAGAEIGTGAAIRQGVIVQEGSMVGMGSVVTKNVDSNSIFLGSPAKFFKKIEEFKC